MSASRFHLQTSAGKGAAADPAAEVARLETLLAERGAELRRLQDELRAFKARYARTVGELVAELTEIEREIRRAEARLVGLEEEPEDERDEGSSFYEPSPETMSGKTGLRKLFWSVARLFHPDHAAGEEEARRRHAIMAEASRAYTDGDVESLHTLLGDEQLQFYCASAASADEPEDAATRLLNLREELITVEFGFKRITQDNIYQLMLRTNEEWTQGRDALKQMAEQISRKITKARNRLAHLS